MAGPSQSVLDHWVVAGFSHGFHFVDQPMLSEFVPQPMYGQDTFGALGLFARPIAVGRLSQLLTDLASAIARAVTRTFTERRFWLPALVTVP